MKKRMAVAFSIRRFEPWVRRDRALDKDGAPRGQKGPR
jgi:hypothetical protein